ncbi:MAG TPA: hypothetical protein VK497_03475 [Candidatus Saccharimonadales bacterium]|nr:hypothetical protein [Candidatus Saccharimonadales bacterium]
MSEEQLVAEGATLSRWQQHRFMLLIGFTIIIALFLVGISLALYNSSGTAQLDLSRPGFQSVREQASQSNDFNSFPSTGTLDQSALNQFRTLYDKQVKQVTAVDGFSGDVMNDQALSIDTPTAENQ